MTINQDDFYFKDFKRFRKFKQKTNSVSNDNENLSNVDNDNEKHDTMCDINVHVIPLENMSAENAPIIMDLLKNFLNHVDPDTKLKLAMQNAKKWPLKKMHKGKLVDLNDKEVKRIKKIPEHLKILAAYDPDVLALLAPFMAGKCSYKKMNDRIIQYLIVKFVEEQKTSHEFGKIISKLQDEWPN